MNTSKKITFSDQDDISYLPDDTDIDNNAYIDIPSDDDMDTDNHEQDIDMVDRFNIENDEQTDILNNCLREMDAEYYVHLVNTFIKHYNNKYNKIENLLHNVVEDLDTNPQLELFYEAMEELKQLKNTLQIDDEYEALTYIFDKKDYERLIYSYPQNYCLEYTDRQLYSPSLIILLNHIVINNVEEFNIYTLNNY